MEAPYKLLWLYILDECNHAGIWEVDFDIAEIKIGEKLDKKTALKFLDGKIIVFDEEEKWFIPDFIDIQYVELNYLNRVHKSVIDILNKYKLIDKEFKPLARTLQGRKDKDMVKDKDKDKEKGDVIFPFDSDLFKHSWGYWINYRAEIKKPYRSVLSEQAALKQLSNYDEPTAIKMIEQSIASGWQGIFELKHNGRKSTRVDEQSGQELVSQIKDYVKRNIDN